MYALTELFIYKFLFCVGILVALHLFSFRQKHRSHYLVRLLITSLISVGLAVAIPLPEYFYNSIATSIIFFLIFMLCTFSIYFVYDMPIKNIFFIAVTSYTTQHISHELFSLESTVFGLVTDSTMGLYGNSIIDFTSLDTTHLLFILVYLETFFVAYAAVYLLLGRKINKTELNINNTPMLILSCVILLVDIILNAVVIYIKEDYNKTYAIVGCIYNLLCCGMILFILLSLATNKRLKVELETTTKLLEKAEEQYRSNKENVDLINIKCHDLKHMLNEYAAEGKINQSLAEELKDTVQIYDSNVKTNNEALDLILTEKSLFCKKRKIKLTCMADCSGLNYISVTDLYSMFVNIIDNAIDAVNRLSDPEKRNIDLIVRNVNSFVSIIVSNYYEGELVKSDDGLIETSKKDKTSHGYGLKSIRYIVSKYNGDMNISFKNNIFTLSILFPSKAKEPNETDDHLLHASDDGNLDQVSSE